MFTNCCKPNRADVVEEGKEEAMSHSNIFPTFTIKDLAKAPGSVRNTGGSGRALRRRCPPQPCSGSLV